MNILFYCPFYFDLKSSYLKSLGGIESLNIDLAKYLNRTKYKIFLATHCDKIIKQKNLTNIPINYLLSNKSNYKFESIISSNDPRVFDHFKSSKKILWLHNKLNIEKAIRKKKFFSILRNNISAVFVSKFLMNNTSNIYNFKRKFIIPNFLTTEFDSNKINSIRHPYFVWSVARNKGLDKIIEIWKNNIFIKDKKIKLYIFGINIENISKKKINQLTKSNIFIKGRVSKKKLINFYNKSMGMICLGYDETFCLNAIESFSCGLPIITFGYTSLNELSNNNNSFIIKRYDELPKIIFKIVNLNNNKRLKIINYCKNYSKKFSLKRTFSLWSKLLANET